MPPAKKSPKSPKSPKTPQVAKNLLVMLANGHMKMAKKSSPKNRR